ncbi:MAG: hypothetical protein PHS94_03025 [Erysipelotrichaceae bacterium]|nr:hypothetical protein [Erysipelotrichaceae bacterium]
MNLTYWEITLRISNAQELVRQGMLEKVSFQLEVLAGGAPIWCLYHDYLMLEIKNVACGGDDINPHAPRSHRDLEKVIAALVQLLFDCEITAWMMYRDSIGSHYVTFFNNYQSHHITKTSSEIEFVFGDYK